MIEEIEIVEYKGFKNLKLENLSQINIISGENNIGKTALLEALFVSNDMLDINGINRDDFLVLSLSSLFSIAQTRDIEINKIEKYLKNIQLSVKIRKLKFNIKYKSFSFLSLEEKKFYKKNFQQDYKDFIVGYSHNSFDILPIKMISTSRMIYNYINSSKPTNKNLVELYSQIQSKGIQHKFLTYLKLLDNDIEWIEPQLLDDEMLLRINMKNPERSLVSSELGEGTNRYIEILATLLANSNGAVFIDEIENGIHYTKLYDIWKAIIEIVEKEKIQLFVTTHDRESIEELQRASEDAKFEKITSVKLAKNSDNVIFPIIRPYSSFLATVDSGMDIR